MPTVANNGKPAEEVKAQKAMEGVPKGNRQPQNPLGFYSMPTFGLLRKKNLAMRHLVEVIY